MKRIFSMMAAALVSVVMLAGANDLLWDYSEAKIPTTGPAEDAISNCKLYYGAYVNDAPSSNNKLNGVKMNSSGYAYFTKAAVAGKLKLTFGPRKGENQLELAVSTWAGETPKAETQIAKTSYGAEYRTETIELTAEQNNIYISRPTGTGEGVLQKIEFKETIARTFVDFEMKMDNMASPYEGVLPSGVTFNGDFNGDQHGYRNFLIIVPVDGTVRFTIGDCKYGNQDIPVKNKKGETIATLKYPAKGCYQSDDKNKDNVFVYNYIGEEDELTFGPIQYCNYFKAEAAEITPCVITFKDQNGNELGKVDTYEGANLEAIPYGESDLGSLPDAMAFRGWFYMNGQKAKVGDPINGNTTIQAKVTPLEYATVGSVQTYDFTDITFYPEDHETVKTVNGKYHNSHGWLFAADGSIKIKVAGKAVVVVTLCTWSDNGTIVVKDASEKQLGRFDLVQESTPDGAEFMCQYAGEAGELSIEWTSKQYIHKVVVYNVLDFLEKDAVSGYYMVPKDDAASFLMAMVQAQKGDKIFLPSGTYDLGETTLTTIGKDSISIIGESMEGTIIKNAPDVKKAGIGSTATLKINKNVKGTYLQDLTIENDLDYYKNNDGVAVALQDQGTQTVCKNVRLLSHQDTYYSNLQGAVKYFEDCEIHGTVDFICGDGSVYFKNNLLYCEKRQSSGGGSDALTASNAAASDKGYVFEGCVIRSECPVVSLGRAWNNVPQTVFLNTVVDYSKGNFDFTASGIQRWTINLMNANAWPKFGEYNTMTEAGVILTPANNLVEFNDPKTSGAKKEIETVLTAEQAATYTMAYTLGEWAANAAADAKQAGLLYKDGKWADTDATLFLVKKDGNISIVNTLPAWEDGIIVRAANARGGFGKPAEKEDTALLIDNTVSNNKAAKMMRNGQLIIVRDGKEYNALGAEL